MPKPASTAPQMPRIVRCTRGVQNRLEEKTPQDRNDNHPISHSQCVIANAASPTRPQALALATSAAPTVAHHTNQYGFAAVVVNPARTQPDATSFLSSKDSAGMRNMEPPIQIRAAPPANPIPVFTPGMAITAAKPRPMRTIRGISIIPWPRAMSAPASLRVAPLVIVTAVTGPGAMTPVSDIAVTVARRASNESGLSMERLVSVAVDKEAVKRTGREAIVPAGLPSTAVVEWHGNDTAGRQEWTAESTSSLSYGSSSS